MSDELSALKSELLEISAQLQKKSNRYLGFAKGLSEGKSQGKAYVDAGYKSKNPAVDAANVIGRCPIIVLYREIFQKIEQLESLPKQIATKEQKRKMLWEMAEAANKAKFAQISNEDGGGEVLNHNAITAAKACISELNKMDGDIAPTKVTQEVTNINKNFEFTSKDPQQVAAEYQDFIK